MLKHWTIFEGSPNGLRREKLRVTLGANRTLNMNAVTYEALGNPIAVELRFDEGLKRIGIKPTTPESNNAFPLKPKSGSRHRWIAAGAFLTHFGLLLDRSIAFDDPFIDMDGILVLDLLKITAIGRGSR